MLDDEAWDEVVARSGARAAPHRGAAAGTAADRAARGRPAVPGRDDRALHLQRGPALPARGGHPPRHRHGHRPGPAPPAAHPRRGPSTTCSTRCAAPAARAGAADEGDDVDLADPLHARGDLEGIDVHPVPVPDVSTVFERLGPPPGFEDSEVLERLMSEAAALAWRLAAGEGSEAADDEALLAELRAQGVATAGVDRVVAGPGRRGRPGGARPPVLGRDRAAHGRGRDRPLPRRLIAMSLGTSGG